MNRWGKRVTSAAWQEKFDVPFLKPMAKTPENQWLGDEISLLGRLKGIFSGVSTRYVSFREGISNKSCFELYFCRDLYKPKDPKSLDIFWNFVLVQGDNKWCCKRPMKATKGCHGFQWGWIFQGVSQSTLKTRHTPARWLITFREKPAEQMSNAKNLGCSGFIGDCTTQVWSDYDEPF